MPVILPVTDKVKVRADGGGGQHICSGSVLVVIRAQLFLKTMDVEELGLS